MASPSLAGGSRGLAPRPLYFAFAMAMPLTFVDNKFCRLSSQRMGVVAESRGARAAGPERPATGQGHPPPGAIPGLLGLCVVSLAWVEDPQKGALTLLQLAVLLLAVSVLAGSPGWSCRSVRLR
jgi:hypothetical protein